MNGCSAARGDRPLGRLATCLAAWPLGARPSTAAVLGAAIVGALVEALAPGASDNARVPAAVFVWLELLAGRL